MNNRYSRHGDFKLSFIDLLFSVIGVLLVLFMITLALVAPIKKDEGIKKNADFVITLEWPTEIDCDMDFWVRDSQNNVIWYNRKEGGAMYLERDDRGKRGSVMSGGDGTQVLDPDNKEYITLRGTSPGEYIINVVAYSCIQDGTIVGKKLGEPINVPFVVELVRINPIFVALKRVELVATKVGQELTAIRFIINDKKEIVRFIYDYVPLRTEDKNSP